MKRLLVAALLVLIALPAAAQQRRALSIQDFLSLERPGEPQISLDGRWVVYTVTVPDLAANRRRSDLWLQAVAGGAPQRLTTDSLGGRSARWSPDGRRIAFINSRGGTPQVWLYDVASHQQRQVTSLSSGADGVLFSPQGHWLAFVSDVYPSC